MANIIVGRSREIKILESLLNSKKAELLAVFGRRRVGKTYLIKNFFVDKEIILLHATGIKDGSFKKQIRHVTDEISKTFYRGVMLEAKRDWFETFALLTKSIQEIKEKNKAIVIFFDEFPWMATKRSLLLQALDHYWNHTWSNDNRIKLIICGSSSSWIIDNIINNKGGLHNRVTKTLRIEPFHLNETAQYLSTFEVHLNQQHMTQLYMVMGGIPYYLSHVTKGQSAEQMISTLAFSKDGLLVKEYSNLYASLFNHPESYIDLLRIISRYRYGVSQSEIIKQSKYYSKGGRLIKRLLELEEANFMMRFIPFQHSRQGIYYRVVDQYSLFYFYWIHSIRKKLAKIDLSPQYWKSLQNTPAWQAWSGLAFEAVCYKHLPQIRRSLHIGEDAISDSWRYVSRERNHKDGTQIDLLFDRNDNSITLCEIKYTDSPFLITKQYAETLKKRVKIFKEVTRTKKQIFISLISANGVNKNQYYDDLISGVVTLEDLFHEPQ